MMKKIRLFVLKGGLELMNGDQVSPLEGEETLFYSMGDDFDFSVRMALIDQKQMLGQGGFGSVYLANDAVLKMEVAIKVL